MKRKRVVGIGPMWTTSKLYIENDKDYESDVRGTGIGVSATRPAVWPQNLSLMDYL